MKNRDNVPFMEENLFGIYAQFLFKDKLIIRKLVKAQIFLVWALNTIVLQKSFIVIDAFSRIHNFLPHKILSLLVLEDR